MLTTSYGQSMEVTCPNNASLPPSMDRSCSVECKDRQYACEELQVYSPDPTVSLSVRLVNGGNKAMMSSKIQCPSSAKCDVDLSTSNGQYGGQYLIVDGGRNAELTVQSTKGQYSMQNAKIECPDFGKCVIRCDAGSQYACQYLKVNREKQLLLGQQYGSLQIKHLNGNFEYGERFLKYADIKCPSDGDCLVHCGLGRYSCQNLNIVCPGPPYSCIVKGTNYNEKNVLNGAKVHKVLNIGKMENLDTTFTAVIADAPDTRTQTTSVGITKIKEPSTNERSVATDHTRSGADAQMVSMKTPKEHVKFALMVAHNAQ